MAAGELARLEHLSLVSKICTELDNHYSLNDKVSINVTHSLFNERLSYFQLSFVP